MSNADVFVLGYCEDTRALLDLLMTEAPAMREQIVIIEPDPATARALVRRGFAVRQISLTDLGTLGPMLGGPRRLQQAAGFLDALARGGESRA